MFSTLDVLKESYKSNHEFFFKSIIFTVGEVFLNHSFIMTICIYVHIFHY